MNDVFSRSNGFAHPKRNVEALHVQPGMTVADFGSGSGAYVLGIAERLQNAGVVYAVDIQRDLLQRTFNEAQRKGFNTVATLWTDLELYGATQLPENSCDLVVVSNLLFQLEEKMNCIHEAWRILKPRGRIVIIDWFDSFGGLGPVREEVVTREVAGAMAQNAGFMFEYEFPAGAHHYGLSWVKPLAS